jgi:hypothetical protein
MDRLSCGTLLHTQLHRNHTSIAPENLDSGAPNLEENRGKNRYVRVKNGGEEGNARRSRPRAAQDGVAP